MMVYPVSDDDDDDFDDVETEEGCHSFAHRQATPYFLMAPMRFITFLVSASL